MPDSIKTAFAIFIFSGSLLAIFLPLLAPSGETAFTAGGIGIPPAPPFWVLAGAGAGLSVLTVLTLSTLRAVLGFRKAALAMMFGYGLIIIVVKFIIVPFRIYRQSQESGLQHLVIDPNSMTFAVLTAAAAFGLYLWVYYLIYRHYLKKARPEPQRAPAGRQDRLQKAGRIAGIVLAAAVAALFAWQVLLWAFIISSDILGYIIGMGFTVLPLLVAAIALAILSFREVGEQAMATGQIALLTSLFWAGAALIAAYHVMWVVFMVMLVMIWPLNTYVPK